MVKETVYQAADYLGYGRMLPFLNATNDIFARLGIALPLPGQSFAVPWGTLLKAHLPSPQVLKYKWRNDYEQDHSEQ